MGGRIAAIAARSAKAEPVKPLTRQPQVRLRRPWGEMQRAIEAVLANVGEMRARDIHVAVEQLLGREVTASSVKNCLATNATGSDPSFVRVGRGRYKLA
jgi:hypothetical protein